MVRLCWYYSVLLLAFDWLNHGSTLSTGHSTRPSCDIYISRSVYPRVACGSKSVPTQAKMSSLELQQLALNFLATFFSRHPPEQSPSFSSAWGPLCGLSLPITPFQGPIYTAIGPFFFVGPPMIPIGGSGVVCAGSGPNFYRLDPTRPVNLCGFLDPTRPAGLSVTTEVAKLITSRTCYVLCAHIYNNMFTFSLVAEQSGMLQRKLSS